LEYSESDRKMGKYNFREDVRKGKRGTKVGRVANPDSHSGSTLQTVSSFFLLILFHSSLV